MGQFRIYTLWLPIPPQCMANFKNSVHAWRVAACKTGCITNRQLKVSCTSYPTLARQILKWRVWYHSVIYIGPDSQTGSEVAKSYGYLRHPHKEKRKKRSGHAGLFVPIRTVRGILQDEELATSEVLTIYQKLVLIVYSL